MEGGGGIYALDMPTLQTTLYLTLSVATVRDPCGCLEAAAAQPSRGADRARVGISAAAAAGRQAGADHTPHRVGWCGAAGCSESSGWGGVAVWCSRSCLELRSGERSQEVPLG